MDKKIPVIVVAAVAAATIALRRFLTLSIVAVAPEFRRRISEFHAEFIPARQIVISTPHHAPQCLQSCVGIFDPKLAAGRPVQGRKNQSSIKIYYCRRSWLGFSIPFNL